MATTNFSNGTLIVPAWLNDVDAFVYDAAVNVPWTGVTWTGSNVTHSGNHTWSGNMTINGNTVLGNASGDTLTIAPSAVTWSNNPTHSGNHTFSGNLSLSTGQIVAGQYTPTLTNTTNVAASTANASTTYIRVGNIVNVAGQINIDPTSASVLTEIAISLPIASNLSSGVQLNGTASRVVATGLPQITGSIIAETTGDTAILRFINDTDVASRGWSFNFQYVIA
jgi:hypothetical protein